MEALQLPDLSGFSVTEQMILLSTFNNVPLPSTLLTLNLTNGQFAEMQRDNPDFDECYRAILLYNLNAHHSTLKTSANLGDIKSITTLLDRDDKKRATSDNQTDFLARALLEAKEMTTHAG